VVFRRTILSIRLRNGNSFSRRNLLVPKIEPEEESMFSVRCYHLAFQSQGLTTLPITQEAHPEPRSNLSSLCLSMPWPYCKVDQRSPKARKMARQLYLDQQHRTCTQLRQCGWHFRRTRATSSLSAPFITSKYWNVGNTGCRCCRNSVREPGRPEV
jgi:hypothetical protein